MLDSLNDSARDTYHVISDNYLVRSSSGDYMFTDNNEKTVSSMYDSIYQVPDFNYNKMVMGEDHAGIWLGSDVRTISPLDKDGLGPNITKVPLAYSYLIESNTMKGLFNVENHVQVLPQYSILNNR